VLRPLSLTLYYRENKSTRVKKIFSSQWDRYEGTKAGRRPAVGRWWDKRVGERRNTQCITEDGGKAGVNKKDYGDVPEIFHGPNNATEKDRDPAKKLGKKEGNQTITKIFPKTADAKKRKVTISPGGKWKEEGRGGEYAANGLLLEIGTGHQPNNGGGIEGKKGVSFLVGEGVHVSNHTGLGGAGRRTPCRRKEGKGRPNTWAGEKTEGAGRWAGSLDGRKRTMKVERRRKRRITGRRVYGHSGLQKRNRVGSWQKKKGRGGPVPSEHR